MKSKWKLNTEIYQGRYCFLATDFKEDILELLTKHFRGLVQ